ncbi:MAG: hypothetical protein ACLS3V_06090 [Streptococcus sp.]
MSTLSRRNEVVTQFPDHFRLLSPYDEIAYRLVEELATNAVNYAIGGTISLKIDVHMTLFLSFLKMTAFKRKP